MRTKKAIVSSIIEIVPILIVSIIGFIKTKIFIKYLGSDMNGYFQFINQFMSYLFLAEAGFATALTYKLYKPIANNDRKKISALFYGGLKIFRRIAIIITIGILILTIIFSIFLNENALLKSIIILSFIIISFSNTLSYFFYSKVYQAIFAANQENFRASLITNITKIISEIVIIIVTIFYPSLLLIAVIMFVAKAVEEITFRIICKRKFSFEKISESEYDTSAYKMTKDLFASQIGYLAFNNIDTLIIMFTKSLGAVAVSIYSSYNYIQKFVFSLIAKISTVVMNMLGNIFVKEDVETSKKIFNEYLLFDFIVATVCGLCFFIGARGFVNIWIQEKQYLLSLVAISSFSFNLFASICMEPLTSVIAANGLFKESKYYTIISSAINLVLSILFSIFWGISGVLIATGISYSLDIFFRSFLIKKKVFNNVNIKIYSSFILATVIFFSLQFVLIQIENWFFRNCVSYFSFGCFMLIAFTIILIVVFMIYLLFFKNTKNLLIRFKKVIKNEG